MDLTKKKALELTIELWEWLAETGGVKREWSGWKEYGDDIRGDCFLCEYTKGDCSLCPLTQFGGDSCCDTYYSDWESDMTKTGRKKYAKLFLKQLKEV